jgi:hypothetical protein
MSGSLKPSAVCPANSSRDESGPVAVHFFISDLTRSRKDGIIAGRDLALKFFLKINLVPRG